MAIYNRWRNRIGDKNPRNRNPPVEETLYLEKITVWVILYFGRHLTSPLLSTENYTKLAN